MTTSPNISGNKHRNFSSKAITLNALLLSVSMLFSYVEFLIPLVPSIPGIKLGLANLIFLLLIYNSRIKEAIYINICRILLSGILFSGLFAIIFALAGAIFSMSIMLLLRKCRFFSIIGVSMAGAVAHNMGQLIIALFLVATPKLFYIAPYLIISGCIMGILLGFTCHILMMKLPKNILNKES